MTRKDQEQVAFALGVKAQWVIHELPRVDINDFLGLSVTESGDVEVFQLGTTDILWKGHMLDVTNWLTNRLLYKQQQARKVGPLRKKGDISNAIVHSLIAKGGSNVNG